MKNYLLSLTKNCKLWKNESILVPPFLLSFTRALFEWARKYLSRVSMTVSQKITMVLHKKGVQSYFQRQCYKSILILEVNFLTLWILAIIPRQAIFAMLKTWILTFLNNLWTMLQNLELCNISFHINTSKRFICRMYLWICWLQFCTWRFTVQYLYLSLYLEK